MGVVKLAVLLLCAAVVNATGAVPTAAKLGRLFLENTPPVGTSPPPSPPPPPPASDGNTGLQAGLSATVKEGELSAGLIVEQTTTLPSPPAPPPAPSPSPPAPAPIPTPVPPPATIPPTIVPPPATVPPTTVPPATIPGTNIPTLGLTLPDIGIFKPKVVEPIVTPPPAPVNLNVALSANVKEGELEASTEVVAGSAEGSSEE